MQGQSGRVGEETFHVALTALGHADLPVLVVLIGDQQNGREEVVETFCFLGRLLGPVVDLAEVVVENHAEPNAAVVVGFVPHGGQRLIVRVFFHSLLEFGPVFDDELVQHEGLGNGIGQSLGMRRAWFADSRHGGCLEVVCKCQVKQDDEEQNRSHFFALSGNTNRSAVDVVVHVDVDVAFAFAWASIAVSLSGNRIVRIEGTVFWSNLDPPPLVVPVTDHVVGGRCFGYCGYGSEWSFTACL